MKIKGTLLFHRELMWFWGAGLFIDALQRVFLWFSLNRFLIFQDFLYILRMFGLVHMIVLVLHQERHVWLTFWLCLFSYRYHLTKTDKFQHLHNQKTVETTSFWDIFRSWCYLWDDRAWLYPTSAIQAWGVRTYQRFCNGVNTPSVSGCRFKEHEKRKWQLKH